MVRTLISGWMYQTAGLHGCLWASTGLVLAAGLCSLMLPAGGIGESAPALAGLRSGGD